MLATLGWGRKRCGYSLAGFCDSNFNYGGGATGYIWITSSDQWP